MRRYRFSGWPIFVTVFPIIGFFMAGFGIRNGRRDIYILTYGRTALGRMTGKRPRGRRSTRCRNTGCSSSTRTTAVARGLGLDQDPDTSKVEDDEHERLLYDPVKPASIVLMDALPGDVTIDHSGGFTASGTGLRYLLTPAATVIVLAALLFYVLA